MGIVGEWVINKVESLALQDEKKTLHFDGCSRQNPRPSGRGYALASNNDQLTHGYACINGSMNNKAEYMGC